MQFQLHLLALATILVLFSTSTHAAHPEEWPFTPTLEWPHKPTVAPLIKKCVEARIHKCPDEVQPMAHYPRMSECSKAVFRTCGPIMLLPPPGWDDPVEPKVKVVSVAERRSGDDAGVGGGSVLEARKKKEHCDYMGYLKCTFGNGNDCKEKYYKSCKVY